MAAPTLTYTLTNGTTADASQVQQNFTDLLNGYTDGSKDLSISAITLAGNFTANGTTNTIGNASSDTLTVTASLAADLVPNAAGTINFGSAALGYLSIYLAASGDGDTARIVAPSLGSDITLTLPAATGTFATLTGTETFTNKTLTSPVMTAPTLGVASATSITFGGTALSVYTQATTIAHDDGLYTGPGGTADWVVASGDQIAAWYSLTNNLMTLAISISTSTVANAPSGLRYTIPASKTVATGFRTQTPAVIFNASTTVMTPGYVRAEPGATYVEVFMQTGNFTNTTDGTYISFLVQFPVA